MIVIVEHLEPCINKWLLKEYEFVSTIFKNRIIFTNVMKERDRALLQNLGLIYSDSVVKLLKDVDNVIVLDPNADKELSVDELKSSRYVIIGGIMGDNPPKERTRLLITTKMNNAKPRNIGKHQFTIAGTAYVLRQIELGKSVDKIKYIFGLKIKRRMHRDIEIEIELPYAFPLDEQGNVVIPKNYEDIILSYIPIYETMILASNNDMC
jgi:ribosome biogenesis SPOUT family RNA methylase Rps3